MKCLPEPEVFGLLWWLEVDEDDVSWEGFGLSRSLKKEQPAFGELAEVYNGKTF